VAGLDARRPAEEEAIDIAFAAMAEGEAYQAEALALAGAFLADGWLALRALGSDDPAGPLERGNQ
jgi:hypothetical protein